LESKMCCASFTGPKPIAMKHNRNPATPQPRISATSTIERGDFDGGKWKYRPNYWNYAGIVCCILMTWQITPLRAQNDLPADPLGDTGKGTTIYRVNDGQRRNTSGNTETEIAYTSEKSGIVVDLSKKSRTSFSFATGKADTIGIDTLYRLDMRFSGGRDIDPAGFDQVASVNHYYYPDVSFVDVPGYLGASYVSVWDSVDVHFAQGLAGPRMFFVVRPGGSPESIYLAFTGQDSMGVDWDGALKIYLNEKWLRFEEAIAYQVNSIGQCVPLNWTATYEHVDGTSYVKFGFDAFDHELPLVFLVGYPPPPQGGGGANGNLTWSTTAGRDFGYILDDFILGGTILPDYDLVVAGATADNFFPANPGTTPSIVVRDVFVSRFRYAPGDSENDALLLWTTFIIGGGPGSPPGTASGYDAPECIIYAPQHDRLYVGGWTNSTLWPMIPDANPNDGTFYQNTRKGQSDGFIIRLLTDGTVDRSTYYGGGGGDVVTSIVADGHGRVHVFGVTDSPTGSYADCGSPTSGLPLCNPGTSNYQQDDNAGGLDIFVARFDADFHLTWGSFIGGTGDDRVFDTDYRYSSSPNNDFIGLVGSTTSTLNYNVSGNFQLNGSEGAGFLWLFNSNGRDGWGTHIDGTADLQAVSFAKDEVRVMGRTKEYFNTTVVNSCDPEPGSLSICNGSNELFYVAHYIGEFDLQGLDLLWSTLENGTTDGSCYVSNDRYSVAFPFGMYRYMDMRTNDDDDFLVMGQVAHRGPETICDFPTQELWGMYYKPYDQNQGNDQNEVFMALYRHTHERIWCSMFGSSFPHITSSPPHFMDWDQLNRGCDYPHDILWADGEVIYLVGTTGGHDFDRQCPYPFPGPSYCELTAAGLVFNADQFDGMIARFNMRDIGIGIPEARIDGVGGLIVRPSATDGHIMLTAPNWVTSQCVVVIHDEQGREVLRQRFVPNKPIDVSGLARASYVVRLADPHSGNNVVGRFIRL
jgi:hypothetical protein